MTPYRKPAISEQLWKDAYRPLKVTAWLRTPLALLPHAGLPLDGILEYAAFTIGRRRQANAASKRQRDRGEWPAVLQYRDPHDPGRWLPTITNEPVNFVLPVKRWGHRDNPDWYWLASWQSYPDGFELDRAHWNRRFDGCDPELSDWLNFGGRRGAVPMTAGRYKSYHMPMALIVAPRLEWYCIGAADGVSLLLREITNLGHKRSQGLGEVIHWRVEVAREDWSCWRDGRPMRALPAPEPDTAHRCGWEAIRSPYWHPSRRRLCLLPPVPTPELQPAEAAC